MILCNKNENLMSVEFYTHRGTYYVFILRDTEVNRNSVKMYRYIWLKFRYAFFEAKYLLCKKFYEVINK